MRKLWKWVQLLPGRAVLVADDPCPFHNPAPRAFLFSLFIHEFQKAGLMVRHALVHRPDVIGSNP